MYRSLVTVLLVSSLAACGSKNDAKDCIDPVTYENHCVEQKLSQQEEPTQQTIVERPVTPMDPNAFNYSNDTTHTTVIERQVIVQEKPKNSWLPSVGGAIGSWIGKKYADHKAKKLESQQPPVYVPQKPPVRTVPIVPNAQPYAAPVRPPVAPPKPTYTYTQPTYRSPTVTVRPAPTPTYRSAPSVTVRSK